MPDIYVQYPDVPETRGNRKDRTAREVNTESHFTVSIKSAHAIAFKVDPRGRESRWLSVQKELQLTVTPNSSRLIGDLVRAYARSHGGVHADIRGQTGIAVGERIRGLHRRLAGLDLQPIPVAQQHE